MDSEGHIIERKELAGVILEFLDVAIHEILYLRGVYPPELFIERKKYGETRVHVSRHPELNQYIRSVLESSRSYIEKGEADKIGLVILGPGDVALERYVFSVHFWADETMVSVSELERELRFTLARLSVLGHKMVDLPGGELSFAVLLYVNTDDILGTERDWCSAETETFRDMDSGITIIKSSTVGTLKMEIFAEQNMMHIAAAQGMNE
eukprot:comp7236_c0_seq1/m.2947 comp7236_c0_seq1/g.2947  ORF comp7236_c0_seq1/g.2947 comp7236_c0_seq1/m.2947 type:complete len:209 (-) comp7236_c0_seq1:134-760(-)